MKSNVVKVGVALGGGGARGLAHLGVLKVLSEEAIPIHCIAGTSMGALVAALYALNPDMDSLIKHFKESLKEESHREFKLDYLRPDCGRNGSFLRQTTRNLKRRIVLHLAQSRQALLKDFCLSEIVSKFIDQGNIEDTKIPLGIVATSLKTGREVLIRKGDVIKAIVASSSIPCFLSPTSLNGDTFIDGAVSCPVPVQYLGEMGADVTIGIEVSMREYNELETLTLIEILGRANMITSMKLSRMMVNTADVAICPDTKDIYWSEFSKIDELIEAGMISAREKLPEIKEAIRRKLPLYKKVSCFWSLLRSAQPGRIRRAGYMRRLRIGGGGRPSMGKHPSGMSCDGNAHHSSG